MSEPRFCITGTGRCGTGYIARVLSEAGVPCGHEQWWNPSGEHEAGFVADASWCATALGLGGYRGTVLHQLRHPLDVVSSLLREPTPEPWLTLHKQAVERRLLYVPVNWHDLAMATVLTLAREAEARAAWAYRIEDVDPLHLCRIAAEAGVQITEQDAAEALERVPTNFNAHGDGERLGWDDLEPGAIRDALRSDAERWGYE